MAALAAMLRLSEAESGDQEGAGPLWRRLGAVARMTAIGLPAPGCDIYIGNNLGSLTGISAGGSATVSLPIPNAPAIAGATLFAQSICLTLQNPFNILTSNGGFGTVGY